MLNGLTKRTHLLIISSIAIGTTVFLATRPKVVVAKQDQTVQQNKAEETNSHQTNIPKGVLAKIAELNKTLKPNPNENLVVYSKIADEYGKASVFDSAGHYLEKIALAKPTLNNWVNAGDSYFQAFNLALKPANIESNTEKTRNCYNKALAIQPSNLHVKTNLAMTYVKSDSPMKAIGMLREVLEQDPGFLPAIMSLGGLSMQSGQYDKAVDRFKKVLEIDPQNVNAKLGLAYSYLELHKNNEAKILLNEALKQNIDPLMKDEITKTLNSIK